MSRKDQTRFSLEEPLFEPMGQIPVDEPEIDPNQEPKTPLLRQKKFVIGLIIGVTILILVILFGVNAYIEQQKRVKPAETPPPEDIVINENDHPLLQRIMIAQQELKEADPSKQDLTYPSMDYSISIDPVKRR